MLTRTRNFSRMQKWLIVGTVIVLLGALGATIYVYERYYRGPSEAVFLGTWHDTTQMLDSTTYYRFKPDGTFDLIIAGMGSIDVVAIGKWYAGGQNIYMRVPTLDEDMPRRNVWVWHIVYISSDKILVRDTRHGAPIVWERFSDPLPTASNQAMQLTPPRSEF